MTLQKLTQQSEDVIATDPATHVKLNVFETTTITQTNIMGQLCEASNTQRGNGFEEDRIEKYPVSYHVGYFINKSLCSLPCSIPKLDLLFLKEPFFLELEYCRAEKNLNFFFSFFFYAKCEKFNF